MDQIITNPHTKIYAEPYDKEGEYYISPHDAKESDVAGEFGVIRFQDRPVKESRVSGCKVEDLLAVSLHRLNKLNRVRNCRETSLAITKLEEALHWLNHRTNDRTNRGVEGTSKP